MTLPSVYRGSCSCGECKFETYTEPFLTLNCHCSHCRNSYGRDFASVTIFWYPAVHIAGPIEYETTTALMGLVGAKRNYCRKCKDKFGSNGIRGYTGLKLVATKYLSRVDDDNKDGSSQHPEPTANIYYDSGLKKGDMGLQTTHSDIGSIAFSVWSVVKALPQLVHLLVRLTLDGIVSKLKKD
jgi:hypothetical protein